jgi:hypothetical protein
MSDFSDVRRIWPQLQCGAGKRRRTSTDLMRTYAVYLKRQAEDVARFRLDERSDNPGRF